MKRHGQHILATKRRVDVHVGMKLPFHVYQNIRGLVLILTSGIAFGGVVVNVKGEMTPLKP